MGEPRLWRQGSGIWSVVWEERADAGGWVTRRLSCRTKDRDQAEQFLARFQAGRASPAAPEAPTIAVILDAYVADLAARGRRSLAASWHVRPLKDAFGHLLPEHLTKEVVRGYIAARRKAGRSDGTTRRELAGTLRPALALAVREQWIARAPHVEAPADPPGRHRWLTREQFDRLVDSCVSPHVRLFCVLALHTAARTEALLELRWSQVDLDRGRIDLGTGHGRKRRSVVSINDDLRAELVAALEAALTEWVVEFRGKPVKSVRPAFKRAAARAGISWAHPHLLRHSAATWMIEAGVPLPEVARFLGDSEQMIERRYGKHGPDYLRAAATALERPVSRFKLRGRR